MSSVMDAVSRLAGIASDHPDIATPINEMIVGLLASKRRPVAVSVNGNGNGKAPKTVLDLPRFKTAKPQPDHDCECVKPKLNVHEVSGLVGFDHQTVAKWCITGRIRASKEWRKDRLGGKVRSWAIEQREVDRVNAAGLLGIDYGRNT